MKRPVRGCVFVKSCDHGHDGRHPDGFGIRPSGANVVAGNRTQLFFGDVAGLHFSQTNSGAMAKAVHFKIHAYGDNGNRPWYVLLNCFIFFG